MSYLTSYATRNPPVRGRNLDERIALNLPGFHGDAYVRVFVEDTTFRKWRGGRAAGAAHPLPDRRLHERDLAVVRARLAGDAAELDAQDRHAARRVQRFRDALDAEAELYAHREQHSAGGRRRSR